MATVDTMWTVDPTETLEKSCSCVYQRKESTGTTCGETPSALLISDMHVTAGGNVYVGITVNILATVRYADMVDVGTMVS